MIPLYVKLTCMVCHKWIVRIGPRPDKRICHTVCQGCGGTFSSFPPNGWSVHDKGGRLLTSGKKDRWWEMGYGR